MRKFAHLFYVWPNRKGELLSQWYFAKTNFEQYVLVHSNFGADCWGLLPKLQHCIPAQCCPRQHGDGSSVAFTFGAKWRLPRPFSARRIGFQMYSDTFGRHFTIPAEDAGFFQRFFDIRRFLPDT